jgi:hypothetical protein
MDAQFIIRKSIYGEYWQVRVRDLRGGSEDTVDRLHSLAEAQAAWDSMSQTMRPVYARP